MLRNCKEINMIIFLAIRRLLNEKIGCSLLLSRAYIIIQLLYYIDSDKFHANLFIQLSLVNRTKFCFFQFKFRKISN